MKINSKLFLEFCLDIYLDNLSTESKSLANIFTKKEILSLNFVSENDFSFDSDRLNYFLEKINQLRKELLSIVRNNKFKERLEIIFNVHLNNLNQLEKSFSIELELNQKILKYFSIKTQSELNLQRKLIKTLIKNFLNLAAKSDVYICKYSITRISWEEKEIKSLNSGEKLNQNSMLIKDEKEFQKVLPGKEEVKKIIQLEPSSINKENIRPKQKQTHSLLNNKYNLNY